MKHYLFLMIFGLFLSGCGSLTPGITYGDNYHEDKYERNGFRCESSVLEVTNPDEESRVFIVDGIPYRVEGAVKNWLGWKKPTKKRISLTPGIHSIGDDRGGVASLDAIPCNLYSLRY